MKKRLFLISVVAVVLVIVIALAAFMRESGPRMLMPSAIPVVNTVNGLKMELNQDEYAGDVREMNVTFTNETGEEYSYSEEVYIETKVDGTWYVSWMQMSINDLNHTISEGESSGILPIKPMDDNDNGLVKGSYRIVLKATNGSDSGSVYLADYFEVK